MIHALPRPTRFHIPPPVDPGGGGYINLSDLRAKGDHRRGLLGLIACTEAARGGGSHADRDAAFVDTLPLLHQHHGLAREGAEVLDNLVRAGEIAALPRRAQVLQTFEVTLALHALHAARVANIKTRPALHFVRELSHRVPPLSRHALSRRARVVTGKMVAQFMPDRYGTSPPRISAPSIIEPMIRGKFSIPGRDVKSKE